MAHKPKYHINIQEHTLPNWSDTTAEKWEQNSELKSTNQYMEAYELNYEKNCD